MNDLYFFMIKGSPSGNFLKFTGLLYHIEKFHTIKFTKLSENVLFFVILSLKKWKLSFIIINRGTTQP